MKGKFAPSTLLVQFHPPTVKQPFQAYLSSASVTLVFYEERQTP